MVRRRVCLDSGIDVRAPRLPIVMIVLLPFALFLQACSTAVVQLPIQETRFPPELTESAKDTLAHAILTEQVMDDFHRRNLDEDGTLVCAILTPPPDLVMRAMVGEKLEEPPPDEWRMHNDYLTIDKWKIQAQRSRLAGRIIPMIKEDVAQGSWENPNTLIELREAYFLVFQMAEVVRQIREYFADAAQRVPEAHVQVRIQVDMFAGHGPLPVEVRANLDSIQAGKNVFVSEGPSPGLSLENVVPPTTSYDWEIILAEAERSGCAALNASFERTCLSLTVLNDQLGFVREGTGEEYVDDSFSYFVDAEKRERVVAGIVGPELRIEFRPRISPNGESVWIRIRLHEQTKVQWDVYKSPDGVIKLPRLGTYDFEDIVCIPSGQTVALGGLESRRLGDNREVSQYFRLFVSASIVEED